MEWKIFRRRPNEIIYYLGCLETDYLYKVPYPLMSNIEINDVALFKWPIKIVPASTGKIY